MGNGLIFLNTAHVRVAHEETFRGLGLPVPALASTTRLEGALSRVPQFAFYQGASIIELAAITAISISQAQAFVDGNKRAAEGSLIVFLQLNGC